MCQWTSCQMSRWNRALRYYYCYTVLAGAPRTVTDKLYTARIERCCACYQSPALVSLIAVLVGYCTTNCIGSTFPTGFSSSLQWQFTVFTSVWTAAHHRICRSTASRSPVLTRAGICVPPTVAYLPYRVSDSALTAVGRSQLLIRWPGTLSRFLSGILWTAQTILGV